MPESSSRSTLFAGWSADRANGRSRSPRWWFSHFLPWRSQSRESHSWDVHSFFHDSEAPVQRDSCQPEKSVEHCIRERVRETQRFDVHRSSEVTSAQTGHERCFRGVIFQGNSPNEPKSDETRIRFCRRSVELRVQVEIKVKSPGSHSFPGCNFLVRSHIVWPESDTQLIGSKTARFPPTWG
jgi:hypothetical protein